MTTIAYKNGVLAGDRRVVSDGRPIGTRCKVVRRGDGAMFGAAGNLDTTVLMQDWFMRGEAEPFPGRDDSECIIVRPLGDVEWRRRDEHKVWPGSREFAIGSGAIAARGAMAVGANATAAIVAATSLDDGTGDGCDVVIDPELAAMSPVYYVPSVAAQAAPPPAVRGPNFHWMFSGSMFVLLVYVAALELAPFMTYLQMLLVVFALVISGFFAYDLARAVLAWRPRQ